MKKYICFITIIALVLVAFCGCVVMTENISDVTLTTEDLIKTAPLVFLGKVKTEGQGRYRNADKVHYYADGNAMFNYWITPYTVEILEVYKGELKESITDLTVGTYNQSAPKDKGENPFYLKAGDTAVFCVRYEEVDGCYKPIFEQKGVFFPSKTPKTYVAENNVIDITDMDNILRKAESKGINRAEAAGETALIKAEDKK